MRIEQFYETMKRAVSSGQYSDHWSKAHYSAFAALLADTEKLGSFRHNGLADGLGGHRHGAPQSPAGLAQTSAKAVAMHEQAYASLCELAGKDVVDALIETDVGSPYYVSCGGVKTNIHDLRNVFCAWRISHMFRDRLPERPVFLEIGAGFGSLPAKLARQFPGACYVIVDLPEALALQRYYLGELFPDVVFSTVTAGGEADGDMLEAPGFVFIPAGRTDIVLPKASIDCAINTRSMMEMTPDVIAGYLGLIERCVKPGGLFYCVNRYHKQTRNFDIRIKSYPFDDRWYAALSQPAWDQPTLHELVAIRTARPVPFPLRKQLRSLPPFTFRDVRGDLGQAARKLRVIMAGSGLKAGNPGLRNWLFGIGEPLKSAERNILYGKGWRMRLKRAWLGWRKRLPGEPVVRRRADAHAGGPSRSRASNR